MGRTGTCVILGLLGFAIATPSSAAIGPAARSKIDALSIPSVANLGQWDPRAAFPAPTFAGMLFVTTAGQLVYRMRGGSAATSPTSGTPTSNCGTSFAPWDTGCRIRIAPASRVRCPAEPPAS